MPKLRSSNLLALIGLGLVGWSVPARAAKIACVGDSITYGYGLSDPNTQSYPAVLQGLLGSTHSVRNFGVSGTTLLKSGDQPYWNTTDYGASGDFAPDVVVVMLGTNDAKAQNWAHESDFASDYHDLVTHYRSLGALVYVAAPPPVYDPGAYSIPPDVVNNQVVPLVRQVAMNENAPLIDVYAALSNQPNDFSDTVHPTADGAKVIAQTVEAALMLDGFGGNAAAGAAGALGNGGAAPGGRAGVAGAGFDGSSGAPGTAGASEGGAGGALGANAGTSSTAGNASSGAGGIPLEGGGGAGAGRASSLGGANSAGNLGLAGNGAGGTFPSGGLVATGGVPGMVAASSGAPGQANSRRGAGDAGCGCRLQRTSRDEGATLFACIAVLAFALVRRSRKRLAIANAPRR
jgi:lysophospholipase L1-like esterase